MPAFLSDAIDVDAPDQALRLAAAERAAAMAVPSPESEVWRYSRIAELDLGAHVPVAVHTTVAGADQLPVADASLVAPFDYASMLFALGIGYFVFAEVPTLPMLGGAALIVSAGILIIWRERKLGLERARQRKAMTPQG